MAVAVETRPRSAFAPEPELRETIETSAAEVVIAATPIDLAALIGPTKPVVRVRYDYADAGEPILADLVDGFLARHKN